MVAKKSHRKRVKHYHQPGDFHELTFSCYRRLPLLSGMESIVRQFAKSTTLGNLAQVNVARAVRLAPLPQMKSCAICSEQVIAGHAIQPVECVMKHSAPVGLANQDIDWKYTAQAEVRWPLCSVCFSVVSAICPSLTGGLKNCAEPFFLEHPFLAAFIPNAGSNARQVLRQRIVDVCREVKHPAESLFRNRRRLLFPKVFRYEVELHIISHKVPLTFGLMVDREKGAFSGTVRSSLDLIVPSQQFAKSLFPSVNFPKRSAWLGLPPDQKWLCTGYAKSQTPSWKYLSTPDCKFLECTPNGESVAAPESLAVEANPRAAQISRAEEAEVFRQISEVLVSALGVRRNEIAPDATLIGDLGAQEIDFLDIRFRLEQRFGIKIPRDDLFPVNRSFNSLTMITVQMVVDYISKRVDQGRR